MSTSPHVSTQEFLEKATQFFSFANKTHTTVHLAIKRLVHDDVVDGSKEYSTDSLPTFDISQKSQHTPVPANASAKEYPVLVRISYGSGSKKNKCSTVVSADALDKFWKDYSSLLKSGMVGLIKKKKKKAKKSLRK